MINSTALFFGVSKNLGNLNIDVNFHRKKPVLKFLAVKNQVFLSFLKEPKPKTREKRRAVNGDRPGKLFWV